MRRGGGVSTLMLRGAAAIGCCLLLAHCGSTSGSVDPKYGVSSSPRLVALGEPVPKGGGVYRVGKPYAVSGRTYNPEENNHYSAEGVASWYGADFHGRQTANGEIYDMSSITAAHPTLPIPSYVRVTNLSNRRSLIVRVNDRGPYHQGRLIDVSVRAAKLLGFHDKGTTQVRVDYVGPASLGGSDDNKLEATLRNGVPAPGPSEFRMALSRPDLPQYPEPPKMGSYVPTPASRPFELGQDRPEPPALRGVRPLPPTEGSAAERRPAASSRIQTASPAPASAPTNFDSRYASAATMPVVQSRPEPLTAFAPIARDGALVSGRGLY
jgi:rare lipoprotein A